MDFKGHVNSISCAVYSPDHMYIVSGSDDRTVRMWDCRTGKCLWVGEHDNYVSDVDYSPDGIASCSWDHTIRFWDCETGKCIRKLNAHTGWILCLKYSPDYKRLASGCANGRLKIWNCSTGNCLESAPTHREPISCIDYSPDGQYIATGGWDHTVKIWNSQTLQCVNILQTLRDALTSIAYSPDGRHIAAVTEDHAINVLDCHTGKIVWSGMTSKLKSWGKQVIYSQNGEYIISVTWGSVVRVWDSKKGCFPIWEQVCEHPIVSLDPSGKGIFFKTMEDQTPINRIMYEEDLAFFSLLKILSAILRKTPGKWSDPRVWGIIMRFT